MPLPPPPSDSATGPHDEHDHAGDARVRAHMIGAPDAGSSAAPARAGLLARLLNLLARLRGRGTPPPGG